MHQVRELTDDQLIAELHRRVSASGTGRYEAELQADVHELSEKLREAEQAKSYFLSSIRNELNNPLASILGLAQAIAAGAAPDMDRLRTMASLVHQEAFSLDLQIRNIIAAAEIESGEMVPRLSAVDIAAVAEGVRTLFAARIEQRQADVRIEALAAHAQVNSDPQLLRLILGNLLANAVEFGPAGGRIIIAIVTDADRNVTLSVKDNGTGISEEQQKRLFRRFGQLDAGRTKQHGGHGLGLAVVNECANALGGTIAVRSGKGLGTEFIVTLPALAPDMAVTGMALDGGTILFGKEESF